MKTMNISINSTPYFQGAADYDSKKLHAKIKQQLQENKVDAFFKTHKDATSGGTSALAIAGAILGAVIPAIIIAKKQKPNLKINSFKNFMEFLNIDYQRPEFLAVGLGSIGGGLLGGLNDRHEKNKLKKLEEATFQAMNIIIPTYLVTESMEFCKSKKSLNNGWAKAGCTLGGVILGVNTAVLLSNAIDKKIFNKYECNPDRKFRSRDLVVHVDDLVGALVISKWSFAEKLQLNKFLPAIFAWNGYEVGNS